MQIFIPGKRHLTFKSQNYFARKNSKSVYLRSFFKAGVAQLVEHDLAKVGVAGPSPVSRSVFKLLVVSYWLFG